MKILPVGGELFHVDRETDMKKLVAGFRNFANAPQKALQSRVIYIYICMYIHIYMCIYVYMYIYIYVYIFRHKCKFNKVRIKSKPPGGRRATLSYRDSKRRGAPPLHFDRRRSPSHKQGDLDEERKLQAATCAASYL
jgi:hypothetical protein